MALADRLGKGWRYEAPITGRMVRMRRQPNTAGFDHTSHSSSTWFYAAEDQDWGRERKPR